MGLFVLPWHIALCNATVRVTQRFVQRNGSCCGRHHNGVAGGTAPSPLIKPLHHLLTTGSRIVLIVGVPCFL